MTLHAGIAVLVLFPAEGVGPRQALQGLAKLPRRPAGLRARALNSKTELQFLIIYFNDFLFFSPESDFHLLNSVFHRCVSLIWLEASVQTSFRIPRHWWKIIYRFKMIKKHTSRRRTSLAKQLWGLGSPAGRCPLVHYHTLRLSSTFYFIIEVRVLVNAIIRVFLKMKNPLLWAGLRNPIVSMYKEPKYQIWVSEVPFICTQLHWKWPYLGAKKWDFGCSNPKTETTFCRQLSPKMVE